MEEKLICSVCGKKLSEEAANHFDGQIMCKDCFELKTTVCECCGERIWEEDARGNNRIILCNHCYEYNYTNCEECGALIHNDDAYYENSDNDYPYCYTCYEKLFKSSIKSYCYKPDPIFYGSGSFYMGVELEIDDGGEDNDNADELLCIGNFKNNRIYCKHDGSIENGFEIVSHPMGLEYHLNDMPWLKIFDKAISMGYRSHQTSTCGLHVHVNRTAFGDDYDSQEEAIARVIYFVEKHWDKLLKFSRRTEANINRWASRYGISSNAKDTYKNAKDNRRGRYVAVNLENDNTIEFRLFRGTLRYTTFAATLQLVYEICRFAIMLTDSELENMSWDDFVSKIDPMKKELLQYLKEKNIIEKGEK